MNLSYSLLFFFELTLNDFKLIFLALTKDFATIVKHAPKELNNASTGLIPSLVLPLDLGSSKVISKPLALQDTPHTAFVVSIAILFPLIFYFNRKCLYEYSINLFSYRKHSNNFISY